MSEENKKSKIGAWLFSALTGGIVFLKISVLTGDVKQGAIAGILGFLAIGLIASRLQSHHIWVHKSTNYIAAAISAIICFEYRSQEITPLETVLLIGVFYALYFVKLRLSPRESTNPKGQRPWPTNALVLSFGIGTGHTIIDSSFGITGSILIMAATGLAVGSSNRESLKDENVEGKEDKTGKSHPWTNKTINKRGYLPYLGLGLLGILASWRWDFLHWVEGSSFHWAYYSGPAMEYMSAGRYASPNQYSGIAVAIASTISRNGWTGIYTFQAILYSIVVGCIAWLGSKKKSSLAVVAAFITVLLFADPGSVGPQAFPSSGLMRFMPAVLFVGLQLWLSETPKEKRTKITKIVATSLFLISVAWSAESLICTVAAITIASGWAISYSLARYINEKIIKRNKDNQTCREVSGQRKQSETGIEIVALLAGLSIAIVGACAWYGLINLDYAINYVSKRHGWTEPKGWITLIPLYYLLAWISYIIIGRPRRIVSNILLIMPAGMCMAYISYRPVSNNITACLAVGTMVAMSGIAIHRGNIKAEKRELSKSNIQESENETAIKGCQNFFVGSIAILSIVQVGNIQKIYSASSKGFPWQLQGEIACNDGDQKVRRIANELGLEYTGLKKGSTAIVLLSLNAHSKNLGICHIDNEGNQYFPLFMQPAQLYLDPLPEQKSKELIQKLIEKRHIKKIILISDEKASEILLLNNITMRMGDKYKASAIPIKTSLGRNLNFTYTILTEKN